MSVSKGNLVRILKDNPDGSYLLKGDDGEVVSDITEDGFVAVDFSFEFADSHDCDGLARNGWFIKVENLEVIY